MFGKLSAAVLVLFVALAGVDASAKGGGAGGSGSSGGAGSSGGSAAAGPAAVSDASPAASAGDAPSGDAPAVAGVAAAGATTVTVARGKGRLNNPSLTPAPPGSSRLAPGREAEQHIHAVGEKARSMERNLQDLQPGNPRHRGDDRRDDRFDRHHGFPDDGVTEGAADDKGFRVFHPSELQGKPTTLDELKMELEQGR